MIYIAGPFFNVPQMDRIVEIEELLERLKIPFFSPRREGVLDPAHSSDEEREHIFQMNENALYNCSLMIAVTRYELSRGSSLSLYEEGFCKQLELPDTGTVWEMGLAYGRGKPIVAYHNLEGLSLVDREKHTCNVMLSKSVNGFVYDAFSLERFLKALQSKCEGSWDPGHVRAALARMINERYKTKSSSEPEKEPLYDIGLHAWRGGVR